MIARMNGMMKIEALVISAAISRAQHRLLFRGIMTKILF